MMRLNTYITGFAFSLLLVLGAYFYVTISGSSRGSIILVIMILAVAQVFVQLKYFFHISFKPQSRMDLLILIFTTIGIGILVGGSLWIMYHLNYSMTPQDMYKSIIHNEGMNV